MYILKNMFEYDNEDLDENTLLIKKKESFRTAVSRSYYLINVLFVWERNDFLNTSI